MPSRDRLLALGLLAAVALALWVGVARPIAGMVTASQDEAAVLQARLDGYRRVIARRGALEQELTELEARRDDGGDYLRGATPALAAADLQRRLAQIVGRHGGRMVSQQSLPERAEEGFTRIATQARLSASVEALRAILYDIEQGRPRLLVASLSARSQGGDGRLDVTLTVHGYREAGT